MLTRRKLLRDAALGLWLTPTILLLPLTLAAISDPTVIVEQWQSYLLFFGLPYILGMVLLILGKRAND